jgi:flavodoxin
MVNLYAYPCMRILILYESRRGFTLTVARAMRDALRTRGYEAFTAPIRAVDLGSIAAADALVVGTWVEGMIVLKVGPARPALEGIGSLPDLDGRPVGLFCTCFASPRRTMEILAARVRAKGGVVTVGAVFKRRKIRGLDEFVDRFVAEASRVTESAA